MYKEFASMPLQSRIWIYQSERTLTDEEVASVDRDIAEFCDKWQSHGMDFYSSGKVFYNRFVILCADTGQADVSGCSIDTSVAFIQALESTYNFSLFNRLLFPYFDEDRVVAVTKQGLKDLFAKGLLDDSTMVFDNMVKTKQELTKKWIVPLKDSWYKKMIS